jgi:hypothetical protein
MSPDRGAGDKVEDEHIPSEVTLPKDEEDPLKKIKVSPSKDSSQKKSKATMNKMQTVLTSDDFDFIITSLNDASMEIAEKKMAKKEEMYDRIKFEL